MYDKFMMFLGMVVPIFNLPHILKMAELQSSAGQSALAVFAFTLSFIFLFIYGYKKNDYVIMITYGAAILMNFAYLFTIFYYA